nr:flavin reductase family protein [Micromonospora sp. DSM 115978]
VDPAGNHNLAPYSQFQNVTFDPPIVMFSANQNTAGQRKDTVVTVESTGEFVWSMATYDLREAVNASAEQLPPDVDEFVRAGVGKAPSRLVAPARVAESPIHFECVHLQTLRLPTAGAGASVMGTVDVVFGRVVAVHVDDAALTGDGLVDVTRIRPLARLGYWQYTSVETAFSMRIPGSAAVNAGLEGAPDKVVAETAAGTA